LTIDFFLDIYSLLYSLEQNISNDLHLDLFRISKFQPIIPEYKITVAWPKPRETTFIMSGTTQPVTVSQLCQNWNCYPHELRQAQTDTKTFLLYKKKQRETYF
jgi:hypothetical protein